jgi:NAD(P)-dependent dehydrogenase (short-subunit alcohol dehydrogenase family)
MGANLLAWSLTMREGVVLLDGKIALVSGVGPGLGQANAKALAREGATVVLAARKAEYLAQVQQEIESAGGKALAVPTNLVKDEEVERLVDRIQSEYGRLDVVVNNAFRMDPFESFDTVDLAKWRKVFDVNVWGTLGLTQKALPLLKKTASQHGDASVIFILSMSMRKIRTDETGYASSKAALHTAMQALAVTYGPEKVRFNAVAPGWIGGPNVEVYLQMQEAARGITNDEARAEVEANIPLRVIPPQDDIANSVVFFASPWSRVITGQTLDVNGGEFLG